MPALRFLIDEFLKDDHLESAFADLRFHGFWEVPLWMRA